MRNISELLAIQIESNTQVLQQHLDLMFAPRSTGNGYENGLHRGKFRCKTKKCTPGINRRRKKMFEKNSDDGVDKLLAQCTKKLDFAIEDGEEDQKVLDFSLEVVFEDEEEKMNEMPPYAAERVGMHDISTLFFDLNLSDNNECDAQYDCKNIKQTKSNNIRIPNGKFKVEQKDESLEYQELQNNDTEQKEVNASPNEKIPDEMNLSALQNNINIKRPQTAPLRSRSSRKRTFATMDSSEDDMFALNSPDDPVAAGPARKRQKMVKT